MRNPPPPFIPSFRGSAPHRQTADAAGRRVVLQMDPLPWVAGLELGNASEITGAYCKQAEKEMEVASDVRI